MLDHWLILIYNIENGPNLHLRFYKKAEHIGKNACDKVHWMDMMRDCC